MTPDHLKQQLSSQYELVCFEDFAKLTEHTGSLYEFLEQYYQAEYQPQQRLVFYTQHRLSLNQLCHLQLAAALIDISNSFIIVCSPYELANELKIANQRHGTGSSVIDCKIINVESTALLPGEFVSLDTLCPVPWMHFVVDRLGQGSPCCHSPLKLGDVQQHQIQDMFYSEPMQQIRSQMLAGEKPESCQHCWKQESHNQASPRNRSMRMHQKDLLSDYLSTPAIRSLDINLGNTCNFKCRICNSDLSSQHASEELKYADNPQQIIHIRQLIEKSKWYDEDHFIDQLDVLWSALQNIDIYGGETLLLKNLPELLGRAAKLNHAEHVRLHFNTNGSVFPNELINDLFKFQSVDIGLSIDNIGQKFEIERGSVWDEVENNVRQFLLLDQEKFRVYVFCTVNIQNVLYLDELCKWSEQIGIDVVFNLLDFPSYFSIDNLTPEGQKLVISKYQAAERADLRAIADQVQNSTGSDGTKFVAAMKKFDLRRQQDFLLTHKTIAMAMGFVV